MQKRIIPFLVLVAGLLILQSFLPWWSFAIMAILIPIIFKLKPVQAAALVGITVFAVYFGQTFWINAQNEGILSSRIGTMLGGLPSWSLPLISGILPAIISAMFAAGSASITQKN